MTKNSENDNEHDIFLRQHRSGEEGDNEPIFNSAEHLRAADELGRCTPHFQAWRAVAFAAHVLIHVNDGHYYAVAHPVQLQGSIGRSCALHTQHTRDTSTEPV